VKAKALITVKAINRKCFIGQDIGLTNIDKIYDKIELETR
jgi:hypothetical protein